VSTAPDPLAVLVEALRKGEPPPFEWVVAYAPDGDLDAALSRVWRACADFALVKRVLFAQSHKTWFAVLARLFGAFLTERADWWTRAVQSHLDRVARGTVNWTDFGITIATAPSGDMGRVVVNLYYFFCRIPEDQRNVLPFLRMYNTSVFLDTLTKEWNRDITGPLRDAMSPPTIALLREMP